MTDTKTGKDCSTGACPVEKKDAKLVKSTDLPLLGNPYPPKDVIQNDAPSSLELSIASMRTSIQPYMAPLCKAYRKTTDVVSIGVAHSQSAIANIRENQSSLTNALVISGAGFFGYMLARRRGFFKKLMFTSIMVGGATATCYPKEAKEKVDILWLMAQNKLPSMIQEQYGNLMDSTKKAQNDKEVVASESKKSVS